MGREDVLGTRWWQVSLTSALASLVILVIAYHLLLAEAWERALVVGAVISVVNGFTTRRAFLRRREVELSTTCWLPGAQERQAWAEAAERPGRPVPAEPQVREGAARLVALRMDRLDANRALSQGFGVVMAAAGVVGAFVSTPWWLLLTASALAVEVVRRRRERRLRGRLVELRAGVAG